MVTVQEAFVRAQDYAREVLGKSGFSLEEVKRDVYKGCEVWRITVGFSKRRPAAPELMKAIGNLPTVGVQDDFGGRVNSWTAFQHHR
jgi:hypothetical protein